MPVLDARTNTLIGVITDRDLVLRAVAKRLNATSTQVNSVMTSPFIAVVFDDADLMTAERLMIQQAVRRLVVLRRKDHAVIGILSVDDFALAGFRQRAGEVRKQYCQMIEYSAFHRSFAVLAFMRDPNRRQFEKRERPLERYRRPQMNLSICTSPCSKCQTS